MNSPFLRELLNLADIATPVAVPTQRDWANFETEMGREFDPVYKEMLKCVGLGTFGARLRLASPSPDASVSLSHTALLDLKVASGPLEHRGVSFPYYPSPGGIVRVGDTGTRLDLCVRPLEREGSWSVVVSDLDEPEQWEFPMDIAEFIVRLYAKTLAPRQAVSWHRFIWRNDTFPFFSCEGSPPIADAYPPDV